MGTIAARKALKVVENVEKILAIDPFLPPVRRSICRGSMESPGRGRSPFTI